jgi:hypothetical protein
LGRNYYERENHVSFEQTNHREIDLMKALVAGVAGGLLASFLMEQFQAAWSAATTAMSGSKKRGGRKSDPATGESGQSHRAKGHRPKGAA